MTAEPTPLHLPILKAIDELEAMLPDLRVHYSEPGERMEAFAALADPILEQASRIDEGHDHDGCWMMATHRIDQMLTSAGWIDAQGQAVD